MTEVDQKVIAKIRDLCCAVDWSDASSIHEKGCHALRFASNCKILGSLVLNCASTPELLSQSERFNLFVKLVLLDDTESRRWKLRLHIFGDELLEAHNHRASFCAHVLTGEYTHMLFGAKQSLDPKRLEMPLRPLFVQSQVPGTSYMIDHEMVHATFAQRGTTTLMLQGPTVRDSFVIYEIYTGTQRVRVGGMRANGPQEPGEAKIDATELEGLVRHLRETGVIA